MESKPRPFISVFFSTLQNNFKSLVYNFQAVVLFHPGHPQLKTLVNCFSAPTLQLLIKIAHFFIFLATQKVILAVQRDAKNSWQSPVNNLFNMEGNVTKLTVNDLLNAHSQINASYPINAPLRCKLCIRRSPLINAPRLIDGGGLL